MVPARKSKHGPVWWTFAVVLCILFTLPFAGCATIFFTPIGGIVTSVLLVLVMVGKILQHNDSQA